MFINEFDAPIPRILNENLPSYNSDRVISNGVFYLIDNKDIYCKVLLTMMQKEFEKELYWILWVMISKDNYFNMVENMEGDKTSVIGKLFSPVLFYPNTENLEVEIEFPLKQKEVYPKIIILDNNPNLFNDYKNGIKKEKYLEIQNNFKG